MSAHLHKFEIECSFSGIHKHTIKGYVKNIFGIGRFHFHFYYGVSTYLDHTHYFSGITGIPIQTENGHIHKMTGHLELSQGHIHHYKGYTFEDTAYIQGKQTVEHQV